MGAGDPVARDAVGPLAGDILAVEQNLAGLGREHAVDQVEYGRFPGTVRADQADDLALIHAEAHAVDGVQAAEALVQPDDVEEGAHSSHFRARGQWR